MRERKPSSTKGAEVVRNLLEEVAGAPELKLLADHERRQRGRGHGSASRFW
jgi:hypothetical protein